MTATAIDKDTALRLYRTMRTIRRFEQQAGTLFAANKIWGTVHSYAGEEAIAAGVCAHLRESDWITSTHRGHGHCIAKGADLGKMFAEVLGRESGYCHGRGGSMHIADTAKGNLGANGIVGGGIPIATGAALTAAMSDSGRVAVCFFGDGGANQGTFHEALNLAAIWKLPIVYVCENNQYAESLPASRAFAVKEISRRADGYGMPGVEVDGCDVRDVFARAGEAIDRARRGEGPTLIVATAFRQEGHYYGDPQRYRPEGEAERWRKEFDPLTIASEWLVTDGIATAGELASIDEEINSEIQRAVEWAEAGPEASPIRLEEIYASY